MKTLQIIIVFVIGISNGLIAQNNQPAMDDLGRIALRPMLMYSPELGESSRNALRNKVAQIAASNGLSATGSESRFVLSAKIVVVNKSIMESAPPMFSYTIEISLYIIDNIEHKIFSQFTIAKNGVGSSESKAMSSAIQQINTSDSRLSVFVKKGKEEILEFYNVNCDMIIEKSTALIENGQLETGFEMLLNMPSVNRECYDRSMALVRELSAKYPEYTGRLEVGNQVSDVDANQVEDANGSLDWLNNAN